ncbi:hypothetical protein EJ07DRAFT_124632, partial [Lizonia empirigonia]
SSTYDHRTLKTRLPVRSALFKQRTGGLVVRWVTTSEYPLLYVFCRCHCFVQHCDDLWYSFVVLLLSRWCRCSYAVCLSIHSSSANSLAELRFSSSHCTIFRIGNRTFLLP